MKTSGVSSADRSAAPADAATGELGTRERILRDASVMFASKGYKATSTREIARAVNVQQPSLFHHFGSKAGILKVLLAHSLEGPMLFAERA